MHKKIVSVQQILWNEQQKGNIKNEEYNWINSKFHGIHSSINNLDDESTQECLIRMEQMGFDTDEIEEIEL